MGNNNKNQLLILLGVGTSIACKKNKNELITSSFFKDYPTLRNDYPHLYQIVKTVDKAARKGLINQENRFSLTTVWLVHDCLLKYYLGYLKRQDYNREFLLKRTKYYKELQEQDHLNIVENIERIWGVFKSLEPSFSPHSSLVRIFYPRTERDEISPIFTFAYLELQALIIKRYTFEKNVDNPEPLNSLFDKLDELIGKETKHNVFIVSLNYDVCFEKCLFNWQKQNGHNNKLSLFFLKDKKDFEERVKCQCPKTLLCKPHGGFNLNHDSHKATIVTSSEPYQGFTKETFVDLENNSDLIEPYLIPYFTHPDEFEKDHNNQFTEIGKYFKRQMEVLKEMFEEATHVLSIGYSFPGEDKNLFTSCTEKNQFSVYSINGSNSEKEIKELWGDRTIESHSDEYFDDKSAEKIARWLN